MRRLIYRFDDHFRELETKANKRSVVTIEDMRYFWDSAYHNISIVLKDKFKV